MRPFTLILRPMLGMALLTTLLAPASLAQIYEYDLPTAQKPAITVPAASMPDIDTDDAAPATSSQPAASSLHTTGPASTDPTNSEPAGSTAMPPQPNHPQTGNSSNNKVFEDMFYSVDKPTPPQPAAPKENKTTKNDADTAKPARLKKQSWRAMNLGDNREQAIKQEIQRLKQEREFDQRQISKNNDALKQVTDNLEALQAQRQALLDQLTILAGKTPETQDGENTSK